MKKQFVLAAVSAAFVGITGPQALAQGSGGQITMIVPFDAGGGSDRVARTVEQVWQEQTGQGFNFQYQPGAAGAVGTAAVAAAAADGGTIGLVNLPNLVIQPLAGSGAFALDDFEFIGRVNSDPIVLMVSNASPYQTLEQFVEAAKAAPGTMTLAFTGALGAGHIAALQMMDGLGIEATLVPTQGGANTLARITGGHVTGGLIGLGLYLTQENGRALAVTAEERLDIAPDVPTFTESGATIEISTARIVIAPAGLPDDTLATLRATLEAVATSEQFISASADQGQLAIWQDGASLEAAVRAMEESVATTLRKFDLID
jgi:tripartite-type tricarboxylate transporter receptor subunit TctC